MSLKSILAIAISVVFFSCGPKNYNKSIHGTKGGFSFKNTAPTPPSLLAAQKQASPLYIVLDPAKVPTSWDISTGACETGSPGCETFKVLDVQTFVERDLQRAMKNYYNDVVVVGPSEGMPNTPHFVADVKIDRIGLREVSAGRMTYSIIEMSWAFAMRPSDQNEYTYSFAGVATSKETYRTFEKGCEQMIENAVASMLKHWHDLQNENS